MPSSYLRLGGFALVVGLSSSAQSWEIGLEAGAVGMLESEVPQYDASGYDTVGGYFGGLLVAHELSLGQFRLGFWGDLQTPIPIDFIGGLPADYVPIDLGARIGPALGPFTPYLGGVAQLAILSGKPSYTTNLNPALFGLGANLGLELTVGVLRAGLEVRAVYSLTALQTDALPDFTEHVWELGALISLRYVFGTT